VRQLIMSRLPFVEIRASELRSRNGVQVVVGIVMVNNRRVALCSAELDDHPDDDVLRCVASLEGGAVEARTGRRG